MKWIKKGHLYLVDGVEKWCISHCQLPFILTLSDSIIRVYFSSRNKSNQSHTLWVDIDISKLPWKIVNEADYPVLVPGLFGTFDDCGAMGSCIVKHEEQIYMYYTGWNLGQSNLFRLSIGLAISNDGGTTFNKISNGPLMDRNLVDPYLLGSPCVIYDGHLWRMWYVSGQKWELASNGYKHFYHIRYAISKDGLSWERGGRVCIDFKNEYEYAIARPCVIFNNGVFCMWYSYRASKDNESYRIGYAESEDGENWTRLDEKVGIDVSANGWDSKMVCYPWVFKNNDQICMLYNGNDYGKTGFGYAVMVE